MLQGQITVKNTNGLYFFVDFKRARILSILFVTRHENHKLHIYLKIEVFLGLLVYGGITLKLILNKCYGENRVLFQFHIRLIIMHRYRYIYITPWTKNRSYVYYLFTNTY